MDAEAIALKAMTIAADICVYTNHNFVKEVRNAKQGTWIAAGAKGMCRFILSFIDGVLASRFLHAIYNTQVVDSSKSKESPPLSL
jgi:hypothetical protein